MPLLIKYGFPLDFDAAAYPDHVTAYLQEEIDNRAMLGPFRTPPIDNLHLSFFMT